MNEVVRGAKGTALAFVERFGGVLRLAALLAIVALVYWAGLSGPFVFDDFPALVDNAKIHIPDLSAASLQRAAFGFDPGGTGRQLSMLSFAVNYALGGLDPWGWKLTSLLVHLLNAWLVYLLCLRLFALAGMQHWRRASAWAVALFWAVHPLQVSTVLYVVQRMETLSLTFVLLALLSYVRGRQLQREGMSGWIWIGACVPLLILSLACKETAALFPAYTLALELTLLRFGAADPALARRWRWLYASGVVAASLLFCAVVLPHYAPESNYLSRNFNAWERVLTQLRVLPTYLGQMLLPLPNRMPFYYDDLVASKSLLAPMTTLWGGLALAGLFASGVWLRKRLPLFSLGVFWFFAAHLITSNVVPLELAFEHRNYFALLGVLLALTDLIRRIPMRDGPALKIVAVAAIVLAVGFLGAIRAATWGDRLLLATDVASNNPASARAAHELGVLYYEMSDGSAESPFFSFAAREFEREATLPSASILAEQSLILMRAANGQAVSPELWARLHQRLRDQPITPQTTSALFALLDNRQKGVELDDRALDQAFMLMFDKVQLPPYSYAQVAAHALEYSHDEVLAKQLLAMAVERSVETPQYVPVLVEGLRKDGRDALADWVLVQARARGIRS